MNRKTGFVQVDPLNSPHPIPWNWVQQTQADATDQGKILTCVYRSRSLRSPDGQYAAYSRIQMQACPNFTQSLVSSALFLEHLRTGQLQTVTTSSPMARNLFTKPEISPLPGTVSMLIPVAWSINCDRLLAREFESQFGTGLASDYALVWDCQLNRSYTLVPNNIPRTQAILMGWSQATPDRVLFRAGLMGQAHWPLWAVSATGETITAPNDKPTVYGQGITHSWVGATGSCGL